MGIIFLIHGTVHCKVVTGEVSSVPINILLLKIATFKLKQSIFYFFFHFFFLT